jgi:hypothetical protein
MKTGDLVHPTNTVTLWNTYNSEDNGWHGSADQGDVGMLICEACDWYRDTTNGRQVLFTFAYVLFGEKLGWVRTEELELVP